MAHSGAAQAPPDQKPSAAEKETSTAGPTAFVQLVGNHFNMGTVVTYDFNLGYNFSPHVAADIGLPLYSTRTPFPIVNGTDWRDTTIIGAPYIDVRYSTKRAHTNITTMLTGAAGLNSVKTYSTGRMVANWYNHLDRPYQILNFPAIFAPFVNLEAGTGSVDRQVFPSIYQIARPYETLGYLGSGEVGANFTILKHYKLGGSAYALAPVGPQKMFSRIVSPDSLLGGDGHHNRFWDEFFETGASQLGYTYGAGPSRISKDNGYSGWLEVTRFRNISVELGYAHSVHYEYNSAYVMIRYNFTNLLRSVTVGE